MSLSVRARNLVLPETDGEVYKAEEKNEELRRSRIVLSYDQPGQEPFSTGGLSVCTSCTAEVEPRTFSGSKFSAKSGDTSVSRLLSPIPLVAMFFSRSTCLIDDLIKLYGPYLNSTRFFSYHILPYMALSRSPCMSLPVKSPSVCPPTRPL